MHGATGLERWGREERTLGRDRLCANDCANELLHLLYGVHCAWKFYTVFSNFLNNFNKSIIIHILELRTVTFREFSNWSNVTHAVEANSGIEPRTIWFHRLWNLLLLTLSISLSKLFRSYFGDFDSLIHICKSYWRSKSLLKQTGPHPFSQLFLISIVFAILCGS